MIYDNSQATVATRIARAAVRYKEIYGLDADVCFINPKMLLGEWAGTIEVKPCRYIRPDYFWIGRKEDV